MKKFILFIAVLTASIGSVWGEKLDIFPNDGNEVSSINVPVNFNCTTSQHVQMIFEVTGRSDWTNNYVNGIAFYFTTGQEQSLPTNANFQIKLLATDDDGFSSTEFKNTDNAKVVYEGNGTVESGRNAITFIFDKWNHFKFDDNSKKLLVDIQVTCTTTANITFVTDQSATNKAIYQTGNGQINAEQLPKATIFCCDKQHVIIGDNEYDVYYKLNRDLTNTSTNSATLTAYNNMGTGESPCYITTSNTYNNFENSLDEKTNVNYIFLDKTISPNLTNPSVYLTNVQVTAIGNNAFNNDYYFTGTYAIEIPQGIECFGDDPTTTNNCFNSTINNSTTLGTNKLLFIINEDNKPKIIGTNYNIGNNVELYVKDQYEYNFSEEFGNSYKGWVSAPYKIYIDYAYGSNLSATTTSNFNPIERIKKPFRTQNLQVKLNDNNDGNNDGTFHLCNKLSVGNQEVEVTDGTASLEEFHTLATFNLIIGYDALLEYSKGNPYLSDDNNISVIKYNDKLDFLRGCNNLIFKYKSDTEVPYWQFTPPINSGETGTNNESLTTNPNGGGVNIQVEKQITSDHFLYYSMPFDMNVGDIKVYKITDGVCSTDPMLYCPEALVSTKIC